MIFILTLVTLCIIILTVCTSYETNSNKYIISRKIRRSLNNNFILKTSVNDEYQYIPPPSSLPSDYEFISPDVGPEIWIGSIVAVIPIIWASFEFTSRIRTQQQCLVCSGSGLVYVTRQNTPLTRARKCWSCGGFLPWLGWKMFFLSTFTDIGNGGVLQRPSKDYKETNEKIKQGILILNSKEEDDNDNGNDDK